MNLKNIFRSNGDSKAATAEVVRLREEYYAAIRRKLAATNAGDADQVVEADAKLREVKLRIAVAEKTQRQAKRDEIERMRDEVPSRQENLQQAFHQALGDGMMHIEVGCRLLAACGLGSSVEMVRQACLAAGEIHQDLVDSGRAAADSYLERNPCVPDIAGQRQELSSIQAVLDGNPYAIESQAKREISRAVREKLTDSELAERVDLDRWARRR